MEPNQTCNSSARQPVRAEEIDLQAELRKAMQKWEAERAPGPHAAPSPSLTQPAATPEAERVVQREEVLELLRSTKVLIDSGQTHNIDGVALYDALRRAQKGD